MLNKRMTKAVTALVSCTFILGFCAAGYGLINKNNKADSKSTSHSSTGPLVVHAKSSETPSKRVYDTTNVKLSDHVESFIRSSNAETAEKNIKNYKIAAVKLNIPEAYMKEIDKLIEAGKPVADVLIAYEFLDENFGFINELQALADKKTSSKNWNSVFEEYKKANKEFVLSEFKDGELDQALSKPNITPDDILHADRISKKCVKSFDELIALKSAGMTWEKINISIGIVHTIDKIESLNISDDEINTYARETKLDRMSIMEGFVLASKIEKSPNEVIRQLAEGKSKWDIYEQYFNETYN